MIYYARTSEGQRKIEIEPGDGVYRGTIDGDPFQADVRLVDGPWAMSLIVNGKCYEIMITRAGKTLLVSTGGDEFEIELRDELEIRSVAADSLHGHAGVEEIKAPMPGAVVALEVEEGDEVSAGAPVVIVEAMKMQNEVSALSGGKVREIRVRPGEIVDSQQVLVVLDRSGDEDR
jgi:acetyl/propionyl-CoA carboxylase alpha subunit